MKADACTDIEQMTTGMNPDDFERMLENPNFLQQMNEMMESPAFQQMLLDNPVFRDNPLARQMIRDPNYRRVLMNPQFMLQQMRAQQRAEQASARGNFPAPGATDNTAETTGQNNAGQGQGAGAVPNPFGQMPAGSNPFAALFGTLSAAPAGTNNTPGDGTSSQAGSTAPGAIPPMDSLLAGMPPDFFRAMGGQPGGADGQPATGGVPDEDFLAATMRLMQNPDFQTLARSMPNGIPGAGGAGGLPGFGGFPGMGAVPGATGSPPQGGFPPSFADFMAPPRQESPADTRPPEERYADQLRQLNDMGFFDFDRNIQALRRSGGSVQGAVDYLLSNP
jgi:ubiquilin